MIKNASTRQSPLVELYCSMTTWSPQDQQWSSWFPQFQAVLNLSFEESIPWEEWSSTLHMVQTSERPLSGKNIGFLSGQCLRKWPSLAQTSLDKNKISTRQIYCWFVSHLLRSSLVKKGFWKTIFVNVYFWALKRKPVVCKNDGGFRFSHLLVAFIQRNHRKSFYCSGKYFGKENFGAPAWNSAQFYCGNKMGNHELAVSLHLVRSVVRSQRGIWFTLNAHGASHII